MMETLPARFITWRAENRPDGSIAKKPLNRHGVVSAYDDPANWMTYEDAVASGRPIGFVFNGDGFVGIDPDSCRDPVAGAWNADAVKLFEMSLGAAVEVSISGKGGHIIGKISDPQTYAVNDEGKFSTAFGSVARVDCFHATGFLAFATPRWQGSPHHDLTGVFRLLHGSRKAPAPQAVLSDEADSRWTLGHLSVDELIALILKPRQPREEALEVYFGGAEAKNGPTIAQLWNADPVALGTRWPHEFRPYDRSKAHQALMNHIAYYCGRKASLMIDVFERSPLSKDGKWNGRRDGSYIRNTVKNAVSGHGNVYDHVSGPSKLPTLAMLPGMTPRVSVDDLITRYGFCPSRTRPVVPLVTNDPNAGMTFENFKKDHARFTVERGNNPADLWLYDPARKSVEGLQMRPDRERPGFTENGAFFVNTHQPPVHSAEGGDVSTGLKFLTHLLPDERERAWFLRWLAFKFRNPAIPGPGVIMVAHGVHGTGRGSLTNSLLPALFGGQYVKKVELSDLTGRDGQGAFNEFAADSVIVTVDEASDEGASPRYAQRRKAYDALKSLVEPAPRRIRIRRKFGSIGDETTNASYLICTNHRDAIAIPSDDRRFAILSNGTRMPDELRFEFHSWVRNAANVAAFARYLLELDIGDYSPFHDPIETEAKADMADAALSDIDKAVAEVMDGMTAHVFTADQVVFRLTMMKPFRDWRFPEEWDAIATKAVQNMAHRVGVRNGTNWTIAFGMKKKVAVYARSSAAATFWRVKDRLREEVLKNDGFTYLLDDPPAKAA